MSARSRRRPMRGPLAVESLERRLSLAADVGTEPDPAAVAPTLVVCPPPSWQAIPTEPFTTGLPEADADRPWIQLASAAETGTIVIWVRLAVSGGVPTVQTLPVWGRLNGVEPVAEAGAGSTVSGLSPDAALASVTGWVFGGAGTDPAADWPQSLDTFTAAAPPEADGVQDWFLVLQSPSDFALGLATAVAVLAGAPNAEFTSEPESEPGAGPAVAAEPLPFAGLLVPGRAAPATGILPDDADAAAWLRDARGAETGSFVLWAGTSGGMPMVVPLFVKLNAAGDDPAFNPSATRQRTARFFPSDGGAVVPLPDAFDESASNPNPASDELPSGSAAASPWPGEGFIVVHTDSNFEILLATLFIPLMLRGGGGDFFANNADPAPIAALFGPGVSAPPPAPAVALEQDTGMATDGITSDGRLAVAAAPDARVEYSTDAGRTWAAAFNAVEGRNRVVVRQVDLLGQPSPETTFEFTLDTRAATPRIALADGTRPAAGNPLRRQADLEIRGIEPAARIEYSVAGGPWAGSWHAVEGQNAVRVRQVDVAGNVSEPSAEMWFRLDSQAEPLTVALARDTGWSDTDRVTADPALALGGREPGATVKYSVDGGASWSSRFSPHEGRNVLLVRQIDKAGNVSAATRFTFTLDRLQPPPPVVQAARGRGRPVTIAGQPGGTRVEYSVGGAAWTTEVVATAGRREGVRIRFVDRAGNASAPSAEFRGTIRPG